MHLPLLDAHACGDRRDALALGPERGIGKVHSQKTKSPRPRRLSRRGAAAVVVGEELVEEVLRRGIQRIGLRFDRFVDERLRPAYFVNPDDDGLRGRRSGEANDDDEEEKHHAA